jgi:hypothetical protein
MHDVPLRRQPSQTESPGAAKVQRILRLLHSQQLCVPLRIFLRFGSGSGEPLADMS